MNSLRDTARQIAEQLARAVPDGFSVYEKDGEVTIQAVGDQIGASSHFLLLASEEPIIDSLEVAVVNVLDLVQDYVSLKTREAWPENEAHPGAHTEGVLLQFWYGDTAAPALAFRPINITEVLVG